MHHIHSMNTLMVILMSTMITGTGYLRPVEIPPQNSDITISRHVLNNGEITFKNVWTNGQSIQLYIWISGMKTLALQGTLQAGQTKTITMMPGDWYRYRSHRAQIRVNGFWYNVDFK